MYDITYFQDDEDVSQYYTDVTYITDYEDITWRSYRYYRWWGWLAYETNYGLYQHYNKSFTAGTKDFPVDHIDDLKLQFDDTWNKTKRGRDADAYYRYPHEIDTVIGHT